MAAQPEGCGRDLGRLRSVRRGSSGRLRARCTTGSRVAPRWRTCTRDRAQVTRLYRSPAPSTRLATPPRACSTTAVATRFARATGDCFRLLLRAPPDLRPDDRRFVALLRDAPRADDFRDDPLREDDFRADDFRPPDFRLLLRAPPRFPADFRDDEPFRDEPPLFFRAPDFREPPLREPPRDDFFRDAMNSLLVRWWCNEE